MSDKPADKPSVLRETDDEARRMARKLVRGARFMALAVIDVETGFPSASRALTATDLDGIPVILASALSAHTKGLLADPRCSLLAGEPGKGDPLAHPRITLQCRAEPVDRQTDAHAQIRERFLDRHPKAALYVDFPDFRFFRLIPQSASLNGGFGRAYALVGTDLVIAGSATADEWRDLQRRLKEMPGIATEAGARLFREGHGSFRFAGVDPSGFDLACGDRLARYEFDQPIFTPAEVFTYISKLCISGTPEDSLPEI